MVFLGKRERNYIPLPIIILAVGFKFFHNTSCRTTRQNRTKKDKTETTSEMTTTKYIAILLK